MPSPERPQPPRLTTEPIPLPPQWAHGPWAGAGFVFDLDRVDELPFQIARQEAAVRAAQPEADEYLIDRTLTATALAYCCEGIVTPDGTLLAGALDDVPAWLAVPRPLARWAIHAGITAAQAQINGPFQTPAPPPEATTP